MRRRPSKSNPTTSIIRFNRARARTLDTPKIEMNPMLNEEFVYISESGKTPKPKPILETMWGTLPQEFAIVRLYVHDDYNKYADRIVKAFSKSGRKQKTYY